MGRRFGNKAPVPKTTWAVSLELDQLVSKAKPRRDTIDDFIMKVFQVVRMEGYNLIYGRCI